MTKQADGVHRPDRSSLAERIRWGNVGRVALLVVVALVVLKAFTGGADRASSLPADVGVGTTAPPGEAPAEHAPAEHAPAEHAPGPRLRERSEPPPRRRRGRSRHGRAGRGAGQDGPAAPRVDRPAPGSAPAPAASPLTAPAAGGEFAP